MNRPLSALFLVWLLTPALAADASAQANPQADAWAAVPAPRAEDVNSLDALVGALYDVISGPAGQARDWNRFKSLFVPGARLIPTGRTPEGGGRLRVISPDEYAAQSGPRLQETGFFEREIGRSAHRYGNIVQVFSTYDSKRNKEDPQPFARGINSIQAWFDGKRWWVVSIYWESEASAGPIPAEYLKKN